MSAKANKPEDLSFSDFREILPTVTGFCPVGDIFATRLQYVADLLKDLGPIPPEPVLAWREAGNTVRHIPVGKELVVGRQTGGAGLSLPEDDLLSRRHFLVQPGNPKGTVEDLDSRNGTAINSSENRQAKAGLCDGDLIYAGRHIFAYLNPARI